MLIPAKYLSAQVLGTAKCFVGLWRAPFNLASTTWKELGMGEWARLPSQSVSQAGINYGIRDVATRTLFLDGKVFERAGKSRSGSKTAVAGGRRLN